MKWTSERIVSITYVLPVLAAIGTWYVLIFTNNLPNSDYGKLLRTWFFDVPERHVFWAMAALSVLCLVLAVAYLLPFARKRVGASVLCLIGILVALVAWLVLSSSLAIFASLPLLFSVPIAKRHLTLGGTDGRKQA
jgi:hypothetical protein